MALLAQSTFTIRRLAKDELNLVFSSDTVAIPSKNGVADLSTAEFEVKVLKGGRELFPEFDEEIGRRNYFSINDFVADNKARGYSTIEAINYEGNIAYRSVGIKNNHDIPRYLQGKFEENTQYYLKFNILWESYNDSRASYAFEIRYTDGTVSSVYTGTSYTSRSIFTDSGKTIDYISTTRQYDGDVVIYNVQLEKSNKATDWIPALEKILTAHNCTAVVDGIKIKLTSIESGKNAGYVDVTVSYGEENNVTRRFTWARAETGVSITKVDVEYAVNNNTSTAPTTGWSTLPPISLTSGQQLWTRTVTSYSTGSPTYSVPANITPQIGQGVESIVEEFAISTSKTTQPTTGWSTTPPTWVNGSYIWTRTKITYKNPTQVVYTGYAVSSEWEAANELEIGGRNYWRRSYLPTILTGTIESTLNSDNGFNVLVGTSTNGEGSARRIGVITSNGWWTLSGYIKTNGISGSKAGIFDFCDTSSEGTVTYNSTDWTYFEAKKNVTNYSSTVYNFIDFVFPNSWTLWYFKDIKLEKGNKATDWTPAPEDVQEEITRVETKSDAAINVANDSITAVATRTTTLESTTGSLTTRMSSAEQKITPDSIVSTVTSSTKYTNDLSSKETPSGAQSKADAAKNSAISTASSDATSKANTAQANAISAAATDTTNKINSLEIGGRNLIKNSSEEWITVTTTTSLFINNFFPTTVLEAEQEYTFSFESEIVSGTSSGFVNIGCGTTTFQKDILYSNVPIIGNNKVRFKPTESHLTSGNKFAFRWRNSGEIFTFRYRRLKLEKGTKATDWTPAPEDVEANITTAKTEAENAAKVYANTKAEAERVLAEAHADGKVSAEEQARINDVNNKLATAKAYAESQDALLKTQQEAYADGKISASEQAAIQAAKAYADLKKTEAEAYADGVVSDEEARAIADALAKFNASKEHAETLVDNIVIGGRNLIVLKNVVTKNGRIGTVTNNTNYIHSAAGFYTTGKIYVNAGDKVVLKAHRTISGYLTVGYFDEDNVFFSVPITVVNFAAFVSEVLTIPSGVAYIRVSFLGSDSDCIKLEKGSKATDWTPAPEDVQAEIDSKVATSTYESKMTQLDTAITDRVTQTDFNALGQRVGTAEGTLTTQAGLIAAKASTSSVNALGSRVTTAESTIDAHTGQINSKVSQTDYDSNNASIQTEFSNITQRADNIELSVTSVNNKVDDIGGRNLMGSTPVTGMLNTATGSSILLNYADGVTSRAHRIVSGGATGIFRFQITHQYPISTAGWYTVSFMYKHVEGLALKLKVNVNLQQAGSKIERSTPDDTWHSWSGSVYVNQNLGQFGIVDFEQTGGNWFNVLISDLKVEKGNKATVWTPAPEDVLTNTTNPLLPIRFIRDYVNGSTTSATNVWTQIQAITKTGVNKALNKPVTTAGTGSYLSRVTNGSLAMADYATVTGTGAQYVQIDLGQVYYDISTIIVHHYWEDSRSFHDTKTQVSTDGVNWATIFDSKSEGIYAEAVEGRSFSTSSNRFLTLKEFDYESKIKGLKTELSGTGIDITAGTLTLYSGAKGGSAGGKIVIAGSNFSVDADGNVAVKGELEATKLIVSGSMITPLTDIVLAPASMNAIAIEGRSFVACYISQSTGAYLPSAASYDGYHCIIGVKANSAGTLSLYDSNQTTKLALLAPGMSAEVIAMNGKWLVRASNESYIFSKTWSPGIGGTWYRIFSDGWVEQGGNYTVSGSGTVTLPIEMYNEYYTVHVNGIRSASGSFGQNYVWDRTQSSFLAIIDSGSGFTWSVSGKSLRY